MSGQENETNRPECRSEGYSPTMTPTTTPPGGRSRRRAILWAWLLCGVLDITSAIVLTIAAGGSPLRMLQGIAGALIGPKSFELGPPTMLMGLAMHFGVALAAASLYYWLSRRIFFLYEQPVAGGILFGVFWLFVMYRGVLPLLAALRPLYIANAPPRRPPPDIWPWPFIVHIVCVGLPIALSIRRFGPFPRRARPA